MSGLWLGCIADDYTGATDVAVALRRGGLRTALLFGPPGADTPVPDADAIVVALKTRTAPVAQAVAETLAAVTWLDSAGVQRYYVKYCSTFDSTAQGNIGPVVDAVLDHTGSPAALACPASPEHGRTVYQGHLFVGGRLLSESSMAHHPLTPMTDPDLQRVLTPQTPHPVGQITHSELTAGPAAARELMEAAGARGIRHLIADAIDDADLATLAAANPWPVAGGGAGFARAIAENRSGTARSVEPLTVPSGSTILIAGSCSTTTLAQVAAARAVFPAHQIRPAPGVSADEMWTAIREWLDAHAGDPVVMVSASAPATERAATADVFGAATGGTLEGLLARSAAYGVGSGRRRVIVAGGETSGAVVQSLGVRTVFIGQEADRGVPWCVTSGDRPIALLLKSGNFGRPDLLVRAATHP